MSRLAAAFLVLMFAGVCSAEDSTTTHLKRAKEAYEQEMSSMQEDVLKALQDAEDAVRKRTGDKQRLDQIVADRSSFESHRRWPTSIPTVAFRKRTQKARIELELAYSEAIRDFTKSRNDKAASAAQHEFLVLVTGTAESVNGRSLDGKFFKVFSESCTWHEAKTKCENMNGHLAVVTSAKENQFLISLLQANQVKQAWLGATDELMEGQWVWIDGSAPRFSDWHRWDGKNREPNDFRGVEDYMLLDATKPDGHWCDVPDIAEGRPGFICEWD